MKFMLQNLKSALAAHALTFAIAIGMFALVLALSVAVALLVKFAGVFATLPTWTGDIQTAMVLMDITALICYMAYWVYKMPKQLITALSAKKPAPQDVVIL